MTILYADKLFLEHQTGAHPESPERLRAVSRHLKQTDLPQRLTAGTIRIASRDELLRVHAGEYVDEIERFAQQGGGSIEADTVLSTRSFEVASYAAGTAAAAVDAVLSGSDPQAVCLTRPPGHHALADAAMGFCLFNNVAVAARHAIDVHGLTRLLIVDWDVHHGNGTQAIFYEDEQVYFFSAHRHPFYPGTGLPTETGSGPGLGTIFNLPLAFGITREHYREAFASVLADAAQRCQPELVLISAGFDAHRADPIGSLGLESEDFGILTEMVAQVAADYCEGRIVSLLEGGYNLDALAESVQSHLETLLALDQNRRH